MLGAVAERNEERECEDATDPAVDAVELVREAETRAAHPLSLSLERSLSPLPMWTSGSMGSASPSAWYRLPRRMRASPARRCSCLTPRAVSGLESSHRCEPGITRSRTVSERESSSGTSRPRVVSRRDW